MGVLFVLAIHCVKTTLPRTKVEQKGRFFLETAIPSARTLIVLQRLIHFDMQGLKHFYSLAQSENFRVAPELR